MSSSPEEPNSPLADEVAEQIGQQLQLTLVELIALSLAGEQLHWNAYGRGFLSLRLQISKLLDEWRALQNSVAERAVAIGIPPDGSAAAVIELGDLPPWNPASPKSAMPPSA